MALDIGREKKKESRIRDLGNKRSYFSESWCLWTRAERALSLSLARVRVYICAFCLGPRPSSNFLSSRSSHSLTSSSGSLFRLQWPRRTFYAKWIKMIVVSDKWAYRQIFLVPKTLSPLII